MLHVELLPDEAGDRSLRRDWARLEEAGLPNLSRHRSSSNRPHVTVSVHPDEVAPGGQPPLVALGRATAALPLPVAFGALAVFGSGPWVLVRTLVVTESLLALHAAVGEVLGESGVEHCRPGRWVPHTTLAQRLDADQVAGALAVLGAAPTTERPGATVLRRARCWDSSRRRLIEVPGADGSGDGRGDGRG